MLSKALQVQSDDFIEISSQKKVCIKESEINMLARKNSKKDGDVLAIEEERKQHGIFNKQTKNSSLLCS